MKRSLIIFFALITSLIADENNIATSIIVKTEKKFRSIEDYQVKMFIAIDIPAFRMPKKKYTVFFKQPDKVKIKSRGFWSFTQNRDVYFT